MFAVHRALAPPAGISLAATARFTTALVDELIVIKGTSLLQVWRPITAPATTKDAPRLLFVAEWPLYGDLVGLAPVRAAGLAAPGRCGLLLTFAEARATLVEYDASEHRLRTVSLHSWEHDPSLKTTTLIPLPPLLKVDPAPFPRCALVAVYADHWAVLPLHQRDALLLDAHPNDAASTQEPPVRPSFLIRPRDLPSEIVNVRDLAFVHGYLEPTLAALHETAPPTAAGLLDLRKDTVRCTFLTLDLRAGARTAHHADPPPAAAALFTSVPLPASATRVVPVPAPLGGVLVLAASGVIYLNQAVPGGIGAVTTAYALGAVPSNPACVRETSYSFAHDFSHLGLPLDNATAMFVPHPRALQNPNAPNTPLRCLLALPSGDVWACDLLRDPGMAGVRTGLSGFQFTRVFAAPMASCLVPWGDDRAHLFYASANGPSLMLALDSDEPSSAQETPPKRRRLENGDKVDAAEQSTEPPAVLVKEGDSAPGFRVVDVLASVGNLRDGVLCQSNGQNVTFCLSGDGHGSQYVVVQQAIHPTIQDRFKMTGVRRMWSLSSPSAEYDTLLVLSGDHKTLVFKAGHELKQINDTGFATTTRTQYVGAFAHRTYLVQVLDHALVLLSGDGLTRLHGVNVDAVAHASTAADANHIVVVTRAGTALVFAVQNDQLVQVYAVEGVTAAHVVADARGVWATRGELAAWQTQVRNAEKARRKRAAAAASMAAPAAATASTVPAAIAAMDDLDDLDDLDLDLYGNSAVPSKPAVPATSAAAVIDAVPDVADEEVLPHPAADAREVLMLVQWHRVRVLRMPDLVEVFATADVHDAPMAMADQGEGEGDAMETDGETAAAVPGPADVVQVHVLEFGARVEDTYLLVVARDTSMTVYQARHPDIDSDSADTNATRAAVVWAKVALDPALLAGGIPAHPSTKGDVTPPWLAVHAFKNVAGHPGAMVVRHAGGAGAPRTCFWLLASPRGHVAAVPMGPIMPPARAAAAAADGTAAAAVSAAGAGTSDKESVVIGFTPFHHAQCRHGFMLATASGHLLVAQMDTSLEFDARVPHRKIHTGQTAHLASFDQDSGTLAVAVSTPVDFHLLVEVPDQIEHHPPTGIRTPHLHQDMLTRTKRPGAYLATSRQFRLELVSAANFAVAASYEFEEYEHVVAIHHAELHSSQTRSGKQRYLVVGTAFVKGEDVSTRGKVYVFETITVVPEVGRPETAHRLKLQWSDEIKAPVTALSSLRGHLVIAHGPKVLVMDYEENKDGERSLVGIAFHDAQVYVTQLATFKSYILVGDRVKSVEFLIMQEDPPKLFYLGKDHHPMPVTALDSMIMGNLAGFLAADELGAMHLLMYAPQNIQSYGGTKLLRRADYFLGAVVNKLLRFRMHSGAPVATTSVVVPPVVASSNKPPGALAAVAGMAVSAAASTSSLPTKPVNGAAPNGVMGAKSGPAAPAAAAVNAPPATAIVPAEVAMANLALCTDGSVSVVAPVSEVAYKRLLLLYNRICELLPTAAALHPKAYRHYLVQSRLFSNNPATMLDLNLIADFLTRPLAEQHEHARALGSTLARIRDDVRAVSAAWTVL
ncbi:Cleavage and polyadenylation specificity factor subunit 1 [Allomyces javanicus]|nr:Cleavage and polyadenylation specificity factor subunit 1 [Allomyces javanicus]